MASSPEGPTATRRLSAIPPWSRAIPNTEPRPWRPPTTARTGRPGNSATSLQPRSRSPRARPSAGLFSFQEPDMPDFLTRFSCLLDVGSVANVARAFDIYTALITENGREDPPAELFLLSLPPEPGATRLWLRDRTSTRLNS